MKRTSLALWLLGPIVWYLLIFVSQTKTLKILAPFLVAALILRFVYSLRSDRTSVTIRLVQVLALSVIAVLPWVNQMPLLIALTVAAIAVTLAFDLYLRRTATGPYRNIPAGLR